MTSVLLLPLMEGIGMLAHAQTPSAIMDRDLLRHEKTIRMNDAAWLYALSPDSKSIGFVGFQSGKVFVIDIASGRAAEIEVPDIRPKTMIIWSNDSKTLAVSGILTLAVASTEQRKTIHQFESQQIQASPQSRFGETAIFSPDDTKIYIQEGIGNLEHMLLAIDLTSETITPFMPTPNPRHQILHFQGGQFQHLSSGDIFSTVIGYSDGTKGTFGNLIFDYQCFVLPLTQGQPRFAPIPFVADITHGIDGSGVMRQIFKKSLFSEPAGLTIIFRESGTKLPDVPIDVSKDKAFETFDAAGQRISTFGGYGVLEGNYISDFDVHPTKPWAVTTATRVTLDDGRTVGMVTIWDLATGTPLQRIETATSINKPIISRDGALMTAVADDGINIFRFS